MKEQRNTTRERIIRKGAGLIHLHGFHSTGLQDILSKAGIPKGSFYFYFKNKEDFGLAVIDYITEYVCRGFSTFLNDESLDAVSRLEKLIAFFEKIYEKNNYRLGCPLGNLALELADDNEKFRDKLNFSIESIVGVIEKYLIYAKQSGSISQDIDIHEAARFFFHGFEGAVLHMKVMKNGEPLKLFRNYLFSYLRLPSV
jgi:TetR/AcrR family transcriptional repressor of nem operon